MCLNRSGSCYRQNCIQIVTTACRIKNVLQAAKTSARDKSRKTTPRHATDYKTQYNILWNDWISCLNVIILLALQKLLIN